MAIQKILVKYFCKPLSIVQKLTVYISFVTQLVPDESPLSHFRIISLIPPSPRHNCLSYIIQGKRLPWAAVPFTTEHNCQNNEVRK